MLRRGEGASNESNFENDDDARFGGITADGVSCDPRLDSDSDPALLDTILYGSSHVQHTAKVPHNLPGEWAVDMPPMPPRYGHPYRYCTVQKKGKLLTRDGGDEKKRVIIPPLARTEMEYLALTHRWAFSNRAADEVLHWARTSVGGPVGANLPTSFIGMLRHSKVYNELMGEDGVQDISQTATVGTSADEEGFVTLVVPVPRRFTGARNQASLEFPFSNLLDLAAALLLDRNVVKCEDDLLWRANTTDEEGFRRYTPELNSGEWWVRTEKKYIFDAEQGRYHADCHLLPFIVFIDDTVVSNRGSRSAKPIVITLGNLKSSVRQSEVLL